MKQLAHLRITRLRSIAVGIGLIATVSISFLVSGQEKSSPRNEEQPLRLTFGVYTSEKASSIYKKVKPTLRDLEKRLPALVGKPVSIRHKIFTSYDQAIDALVDGAVDFVRFGPASYVLAKEREPRIRLLAIEETEGVGEDRRRFAGVIFAHKDSGIRALSDLRGKTFAFGDENSTIGRYLSQAELFDVGVRLSDLNRHEYLGRHDRVATAVLLGRFDAGAAKVGTFEKYRDQGLVEIHRFDNVTKPWIARAGLESATFEALQKTLIESSDRSVFKELGSEIDGFGVVADEEYDFVRAGMTRAKRFATENFSPSPQPDSTTTPTAPDEP